MTAFYDYHPPLSSSGIDRACLEAEPAKIEAGPWYVTLKSIVDLVLSSLLLLPCFPLILLMLVLVRLTSDGPALYTQLRLGRDGREFIIFKIRTMVYDCERQSGPLWSTATDPRVTPLGRVLRRWHLDELPQLWNVLRGEMSLVGPRPERPEIIRQLERTIPWYRERLRVAPGITGLAQILLPPDEDVSRVSRKVACDLCYISRRGAWLDARIVMGTGLKVVGVPVRWRQRLLLLPGIVEPETDPLATPATGPGSVPRLTAR